MIQVDNDGEHLTLRFQVLDSDKNATKQPKTVTVRMNADAASKFAYALLTNLAALAGGDTTNTDGDKQVGSNTVFKKGFDGFMDEVNADIKEAITTSSKNLE